MINQIGMSQEYVDGVMTMVLKYDPIPDPSTYPDNIPFRGYVYDDIVPEGLVASYVHYRLLLDEKPVDFPEHVQAITREETREMNYLLQKECAERMPSEFSPEGLDQFWYGAGDVHFGWLDNGKLQGYRSMEVDGDTLHLWTSYVLPEFRKKGIYSDLLRAAVYYAQVHGLAKIEVATDATSGNEMHAIMLHKGFKPFRMSVKNK